MTTSRSGRTMRTTQQTVRTMTRDLMRRADAFEVRAEAWWRAQQPRIRLAVALAVIFAAAVVLNAVGAGLAGLTAKRPAAAQTAAASAARASAAPSLMSEGAPTDAGKTWTVVKVWQGSGARETETFIAHDHWRVDWVFSPSQPNDQFQVFIHANDGKLLLNIAANTQRSGPDTTFWVGSGAYFLRVMSTGGDWKLAVQELR